MKWIDTHCHLDAAEFNADRDAVMASAAQAKVARIVIPAVAPSNFAAVRALAHRIDGGVYALGIHPLLTPQVSPHDLTALRAEISANLHDPRFIGIGEIGLDGFVAELDTESQQYFFTGQLRLAREFDLPVICHQRKAQDQVLKGLRRFGLKRGIAHAFNGSFQQAHAYLALGFKLGFGGMLTFERARQIRRLATQLPIEALVLETDAPDLAPQWRYRLRNTPDQVPAIGAVLAELRGISAAELASASWTNAYDGLPRLTLLNE